MCLQKSFSLVFSVTCSLSNEIKINVTDVLQKVIRICEHTSTHRRCTIEFPGSIDYHLTKLRSPGYLIRLLDHRVVNYFACMLQLVVDIINDTIYFYVGITPRQTFNIDVTVKSIYNRNNKVCSCILLHRILRKRMLNSEIQEVITYRFH